jgi:hypothetical protein
VLLWQQFVAHGVGCGRACWSCGRESQDDLAVIVE